MIFGGQYIVHQDNVIKVDMVDFGTTTDQIYAASIPVLDSGSLFSSTNVEDVLNEVQTEVNLVTTSFLRRDGTLAMTGTLNLDGNNLNTGNSVITPTELDQLANLDGLTIEGTDWDIVSRLNQDLTTTSDVVFADISATGNVDINGTLTTTGDITFVGTLNNVNTTEFSQLETMGSNTISNTQWGYLGVLDQSLTTSTSPSFVDITLTGGDITGANGYTVDLGEASASEAQFSGNIQFNDTLQTQGDMNIDAQSDSTTTTIYMKNSGTYDVNVEIGNNLQIGNNVTILNNLSVAGDFTVTGTTTTTNIESVTVEDVYITLNSGETGSGITNGDAGLKFDRGTATTAALLYVESNDVIQVGEIGSLQPIATRPVSTNQTEGGIAVWQGSPNYWYTTTSWLTWNGSVLDITGSIAISDIPNAISDTDVFIVSDSGDIKYRTGSEVKSDIGLGNVENTALSTWAGTSSITTVGTIGSGTWQGTVISDTYVANDITLTNLTQITTRNHNDTQNISNNDHHNPVTIGTANGLSLLTQEISLQLSTSGQNGALSSTDWSTFNNKQDALTFGIADTNSVVIDDLDAADNDYAKLTTSGIEGRSYSEVKTDLSLNNVENTALSTWAGTSSITTVGTIGSGTWQGTAIANGYVAGIDQNLLTSSSPTFAGITIDTTAITDILEAADTFSDSDAKLMTAAAIEDRYLKLSGGTLTGDLTIDSVSFQEWNAIGSGNKMWFPCVPVGAYGLDKDAHASDQRFMSGAVRGTWDCPIPCDKGGLSFTATRLKIGVTSADANDYIDEIALYSYDGTTNDVATAIRTTNITSSGEYTVDFTDISFAGQDRIVVYMTVSCASDLGLRIGMINLEGYYS